MKVVILGSSGMLGSMVTDFFRLPGNGFNVVALDRSTFELNTSSLNDVGSKLTRLCGFNTNYVVNCIGAIKPTFDKASNPSDPIYLNAVFPHQLATWGSLVGTKIIHITTDCVFDGARGKYTELDTHNARDHYGRSKSLGESDAVMNLRTSIIGPEIGGRGRSLLEWIKAQDGGAVNGYTNHFWNGLTTMELANCLEHIILSDLWEPGVFHIYSEDVNKHTMIEEIVYQYGLDINITPFEAPNSCDRTLRTVHDLNAKLSIPPFDVQVGDLVEWEEINNGR